MTSTANTEVSFKSYGGNAAENYQRYFVPTIGTAWADALLDAAHLSTGERVLDVACGTGVVTRKAAEQVGTTGTVTGLDLNPAMLAVARASGPATAEWIEASAESIPCPDGSFDVVTCSLGLQFVADQAAALGQFYRVLTDGGRVAISTGGQIPDIFETLAQALARHIAPEAAGFMRHVFSLHNHDRLQGLLEGAGFRHADVQARPRRVLLPSPPEFLWQYVNSTPLAGVVGEFDESVHVALERDVTLAWADHVEGDHLVLELDAVISTGER
jgi:ubiquinone/menaquinone biosynthesis C-methylase UbiE